MLSSVLQETHHNLHTFEFMLSKYRERATARVTPMQLSRDGEDAQEERKANRLLEELSEAVGKVSELKERMKEVQPGQEAVAASSEAVYETKYRQCVEENHELKLQLEQERQKVSEAETRAEFMERELQDALTQKQVLKEKNYMTLHFQ